MGSLLNAVDYTNFGVTVLHTITAQHNATVEKRGIKRAGDFLLDSMEHTSVLKGDAYIHKLETILDRFRVDESPRSPQQKMFHENFLACCIPQIYGIQDFSKFRDRIEKKIDTKIREEVRPLVHVTAWHSRMVTLVLLFK